MLYGISQGASVNPRDVQCRSPLFLASTSGFTDTVQILMERGADLSLKDVELRSPLHAAVGHFSTMEVLCKVSTWERRGKEKGGGGGVY